MDINLILKKSAKKAKTINRATSRTLNIATDDRPYSEQSTPPKPALNNKQTSKEEEKQAEQLDTGSNKGPKKGLDKGAEVRKEAHHETNRVPLRGQEESQKGAERVPKGGRGLATSLASDEIQKLSGQQKRLFGYIAELCCDRGSLATGPVTKENLCLILDASYETVKSATKRLIKKGIIKRGQGKKAKGGYSEFIISQEVKESYLSMNRKNLIFEKNTLGGNKEANKGAETNVVNSSYFINTNNSMPMEWEKIDISELGNIGFQQSHLIQIYREYQKNPHLSLSADLIQNSINDFAYDLRHNSIGNKFKQPPAVVLTVLLKKGQPYTSVTPGRNVSHEEEIINDYEDLKLRKIKESENQERLESEYNKWFDQLTDDDKQVHFKKVFVYDLPKEQQSEALIKSFIKEVFEKEVWPMHASNQKSGED